MPPAQNPYQPPPAQEEASEEIIRTTQSVDVGAVAAALCMIVLFCVAVVAFHSFSAGLGIVLQLLAMLVFLGFATAIVAKLLQLFRSI